MFHGMPGLCYSTEIYITTTHNKKICISYTPVLAPELLVSVAVAIASTVKISVLDWQRPV
jgi:hypothetical protein